MSGINKKSYEGFFNEVYELILNREKANKRIIEKIASAYNIVDKNTIKEITENVIVTIARDIATQDKSIEKRYDEIVELYNSQVNLSHRTSQSMLLQQYSTPATIGYLIGIYCGINKPGKYYEPSAGNGMLTIANDGDDFIVNEIDDVRYQNLKYQDVYKKVTQFDSSEETFKRKYFDAVITNPPFDKLDKEDWLTIGGYTIKALDHKMAILALNSMKDDGKAALIVGGHTAWDSKGRVQSGKNRVFLSYLYENYNVDDIININSKKLYTKMGTGFNVRIILINGRKSEPKGFAPLKQNTNSETVNSHQELYDRISQYFDNRKKKTPNMDLLNKINELKKQQQEIINQEKGLGMPYLPASDSCFSLQVDTPDSMSFEIHAAIKKIKKEVGGSLMKYLVDRLKYKDEKELCKALAAEQIDGVATAVYNIEEKNQGIIIGDQTGIGKGRQAAAVIRYAVVNGYQPIFLTEKPNLFSDLYRDLKDIGSEDLKPFIVNARDSKTHIKTKAGKIIEKAPPQSEQKRIYEKGLVPKGYDVILSTYSQFASSKPTVKQGWLRNITDDKTIIIMDESHNSSGSSATGEFLKNVVKASKSTIFLSATFAKRPDNMPIYALKTSIQDANMDDENLVNAIANGGVALQEVLAAQLVQEGQMIRRERTYEGIDINYMTLDQHKAKHFKIADAVTDIIRDMIGFQAEHVDDMVEDLDKIAVAENKEVEVTKGTKEAGVDNTPYFSRVFNVINQMLFSIKADEVANLAIKHLEAGKKPVIAFSNTMGAFIEEMQIGEVISADFKEVLKRGLDSVMSYTTTNAAGNSEKAYFTPSEMSQEARADYYRILDKIEKVSTGIVISPIDHIVQKLNKAGYKTAEVTGRKKEVQLSYTDSGIVGEIQKRKKINANDAFTMFNNNEADVLLINQSGSTGASAHAVPTEKVPESEVKQRVMIVLQAELNINTEVQKRGRINRTGQIMKPQYDYLASAIPAEQRLQMMLQKKLKSLDANTTSNQKNSEDLLKSDDFLNKYGDNIVKTWLEENPEMNRLLGNLITEDTKDFANIAHKASGRVAILPIDQQVSFYKTILDQYHSEVARLIQKGEYDLELESTNLEAETLKSDVVVVGKNSNSVFGGNTYLEKCEVNNLSKPYTKTELLDMLQASDYKNATENQKNMLEMYDKYIDGELSKVYTDKNKKWDKVKDKITSEKKYEEAEDQSEYYQNRLIQIEEAKQEDINLAQEKIRNTTSEIRRYINFFKVGKGVKYPVISFGEGASTSDAIVVDVSFNENADNPFTPSNINFTIAISDSNRRSDLKASGKFQQDLNAIIGASYYIDDSKSEEILDNWDEITRESNINRKNAYIVTGNILQGYAKYDKGKLISYTLKGGGVKKGILMPTNWAPRNSENASTHVTVPILKAYKIIASASNGSSIRTNTSMMMQRVNQSYSDENYLNVFVPASKKKGGKIFLDQDIIDLTMDKNFNKVGSQMRSKVHIDNLKAFLEILQNRHSISALVPQTRIDEIDEIQDAIKSAEKQNSKASSSDKAKVMRLRAKATLLLQKQILLLTA